MHKPLYRLFFLVLTLLCVPILSQGQKNEINHFIVKETLTKNGKLAIIATDSLENPLEHVNGTFQFSINGFTSGLEFRDGVATTDHEVENSTFAFFKHVNTNGSHGQLFYINKTETGFDIYKIGWFLLIMVPLILILIVMMFRKLLYVAIIAFLIILYINYKKGLDITTFFETIVHGIQNLV